MMNALTMDMMPEITKFSITLQFGRLRKKIIIFKYIIVSILCLHYYGKYNDLVGRRLALA
jgi:hypothetical protein